MKILYLPVRKEWFDIGKGKSEWGAPAEDVFIIRLGNKTELL